MYFLIIIFFLDNCFIIVFCIVIFDVLDLIEFGGYIFGVVIIIFGFFKFFFNGFDFEYVFGIEGFLFGVLYRFFNWYFIYFMFIIVFFLGYVFVGGLMLVMYNDYWVMNFVKGFVCVNELEFGVLFKVVMFFIFRFKFFFVIYRDLVFEVKCFFGEEGVKVGLVDRMGGLD